MRSNFVDIAPTPRVLRVLGEIPFLPWQCFAEMVDNSIDAFIEAERSGLNFEDKKIIVRWSSDVVGESARMIEIIDNAYGMEIDQLTNAVKAGYSSNDPTKNLGLFGMGFNISTARLGDKTTILSTRAGDSEWIGIEIDFSNLINQGGFAAPVIVKQKDSIEEHGTKIEISNLKNDTYLNIRQNETQIRKQLENIYTPLLSRNDISIFVQGKRLTPKRHCVWAASRFVMRDGKKIEAVQQIDRVLGSALFDLEKNRYLSANEEDFLRYDLEHSKALPVNIIERQKRLKGWVGIQRYFDTNDFGIDFIRNGRKILISNKLFFTYENPLTGTSTLEYPVELGTTVGGRIVGEVHVDYLIPSYQKNDFDRTDTTWQQTVDALRGIGPILPKQRKSMGFDGPNTSPIGLLANAYRRTEKGTKNLALERNVARDFLNRFLRNDPEYQDDEKWWQAVIEADRANATMGGEDAADVDTGDEPSDDPSQYLPTNQVATTAPVVPPAAPSTFSTMRGAEHSDNSTCDNLLLRSKEIVSLSGQYTYASKPPFTIRAREIITGEIYINGITSPCAFFSEGVECDYFYNMKHQLLSQYPNSPKSLLLIYLAQKFMVRDGGGDLLSVFSQLSMEKMREAKIDKVTLKERAEEFFQLLREKLKVNLSNRYTEVLSCVQESAGETEDTVQAMLSNGDLIHAFNMKTSDGIDALEFVPVKTLIRIINKFPEEVFDGKVFKALYANLVGPNLESKARERLMDEARERIISFLKDAAVILGERSVKLSKNELYRYSLSIDFLLEEINV
ncbi:ATP-binding protein [Dehalobacter sp. DCM]|uniref:ATP-binding protein n=1 Tax=Dehalobacter sp. DCM TaxID=2907827 RepID=UPI0030816796|nr:ATP-binding protein [Dehalobacter sp. DCM]